VYGGIALVVGSAQHWTGASDRGQRWAARVVGVALIGGAALTLAFAWQPIAVAQASAGPPQAA
jgi:hypothetical protein